MDVSKEQFKELYYDKNLTMKEIAKKLGCVQSALSYWRKKWGLPARPRNAVTKHSRSITKNLLEKLYVEDDLTAEQVSDKLGASVTTILKYIKKYNIEIKGISHYKVLPAIKFSRNQWDFFDGLMAGDGSLVALKTGGYVRNAKISCAFQHKEFADYINKCLGLGSYIHKKVHVSDRYKAGLCVQWGLYSSNNIVFTKERNRWYCGPAKEKIVPSDFRFSSTSMNILYLCDGSLIRNEHIVICTDSFQRDNLNNTLILWLKKAGIDCWVTKINRIYIPKKSTKDFLHYIGGCPVECYKYKWRI